MRTATHTCPACGFVVYAEPPGSFESCPICWWEHCNVQYAWPLDAGPNERTLVAQQAWVVRGWPYEVRAVGPHRRDPSWRPLMAPEVAQPEEAVSHGLRVFVPYWLRSPLGWDTVLTNPGWHDGPIEGVARVDGRAHHFAAAWDEAADDWNHDVMRLRPLDDDELDLELEAWAIWLRWSEARLRGEDVAAHHPALPADRDRWSEVSADLARRRANTTATLLAKPTWGWPPDPPGRCGWFAVRWEILP